MQYICHEELLLRHIIACTEAYKHVIESHDPKGRLRADRLQLGATARRVFAFLKQMARP